MEIWIFSNGRVERSRVNYIIINKGLVPRKVNGEGTRKHKGLGDTRIWDPFELF